ncbi:hypothetical protein DB345_00410 [Spartobacteria bacterium LR76]|nr:hypothetical protein DB345_00410 [Spartobacteria bacterium LR76]
MKTSAKLLMVPAALLMVAGLGVIVVFGGSRVVDLVQALFLYSRSADDMVYTLRVIGADVWAVLLSGLALALPGGVCLAAGIVALRASRKPTAFSSR